MGVERTLALDVLLGVADVCPYARARVGRYAVCGTERRVTTMPAWCHEAVGIGLAAGATVRGTNIDSAASDSASPATLLALDDFMMILPLAS
jgi:hypothetical protein